MTFRPVNCLGLLLLFAFVMGQTACTMLIHSIEPDIELTETRVQDNLGEPWKIVDISSPPAQSSDASQIMGIISFMTLFLIPAIETRRDPCTYEVSYCGQHFKTYEITKIQTDILWLPLMPFVIFTAKGDSLASNIGERKSCARVLDALLQRDIEEAKPRLTPCKGT